MARANSFLAVFAVASLLASFPWDLARATSNNYSPRIQALLKEAQSGKSQPIEIHVVPSSLDPFHQGHTDGMGTDHVVINVAAGPSRDYDDTLLAHELFHVILYNRGFTAGTIPERSYQIRGIDSQQSATAVNRMASTVSSCFPDELIDREMVKRGFKPKMLVDTEIKKTSEQLVNFAPGEIESSPETIKNGQALLSFCLAKRASAQSMHAFEKKFRPIIGPSILEKENNLLMRFRGKRCEINDPAGCHKLIVQLRDAAGMKGIVYVGDMRKQQLQLE